MRSGWALVLVLLAPGACGDEAAEHDPIGEAEAGIADVLTERLGADAGPVVVTCPEDLTLLAGTEFSCSVGVGDTDPVDVDLAVAADGTVELQRAVVPIEAVESYLASELAGPAEGPVDPDCGDAVLLVADVGDELRCTVVRSVDGVDRDVVVTVLGVDGTVRYQVQAPTTTTTTTATTTPP